MPTSFESSHTQTELYDRGIGNNDGLGNYSVGQATSSTDFAMGNINNLQQLTSLKNYMNNGDGTGMKTRTYQPLPQSNSENFGTEIRIMSRGPQQQPNSDNIINRGTAPRRIHMQMRLSTGPVKVSAGCVDDGKMRSASLGEEEEVQSALTEVSVTGKSNFKRC